MATKTANIVRAYVKSMRPYTFFVTGTAGILGLLLGGGMEWDWRTFLILLLLFTSYGINQVINDLLGSKEDRLNAPSRPLVSGELDRKTAAIITFFIFTASAVAVYFLNPNALILCFLAYGMNFLYEIFKGIPLLGNVWFGFMIALAPVFGALAANRLATFAILLDSDLVGFVILVAAIASSLCYYTYFKDYEGDKQTGKNTIVVTLGPERARYLNLPMSLPPFILLAIFMLTGLITFKASFVFWTLTAASFVFCMYTATFSFYRWNEFKKSLELNFECTPLLLSALVALLDPGLGLFLFVFSFVAVKVSYRLMYKDRLY